MQPSVVNGQSELVVDLDGTLVKTDLLWESLFTLIGKSPLRAIRTLLSLLKGKAAFKQRVAQELPLLPDRLPYREMVLSEMRQARAEGRTVVLATAADQSYAQAIADSLGMFDRVLSSDGVTNLSGKRKADAIRHAGSGNFEYIGNSTVDLPIWRQARASLVVNPSTGLLRTMRAEGLDCRVLQEAQLSTIRLVLLAMRPQQWIKNALLFVPLVMAQQWTQWPAFVSLCLAFIALSLAASGTYVLNDLMDIQSDRIHPRKRHRPFACGALSIQCGIVMTIVLISCGLAFGALAGTTATIGVGLYIVMTLAYTSILKTRVLADVIALAGLYVYRILLGGAVAGVSVSHWLAVFSAFMFLSLALSKRTAELLESQRCGQLNVRRGYRASDTQLLFTLGVTSGVGAVLVFCLYISGETASELYRSPKWLWLAAPPLFYWIMRIWFLTEREELKDDPIVFAARDYHTYVIATAIIVSFLFAALWP